MKKDNKKRRDWGTPLHASLFHTFSSSRSVGMRDIKGVRTASLYPGLRPSGMTSKAAGFTLVELLVVVLIIGILAAVALPQYQLAVGKSRVMAVMPLLINIKKAEKIYYLENGEYTYIPAQLDLPITMWNSNNPTNGMINEHFSINFGSIYANGSYCPNRGLNNYYSPCSQEEFQYRINFQEDSEKIICKGITDLGKKLCTLFP